MAEEVDTSDLPMMETGGCRMYPNEFPELDDLVMVQVTNVDDIGATVSLLEYAGRDGYILLSELSRRRMRSVNKHIRAGRREVLQVLRVDSDKGYIDLSKKNLKFEEAEACKDRFRKSASVHGIMKHLVDWQTSEVAQKQPDYDANALKLTMQQLCELIAWPLYKRGGHAYDHLERAANGDKSVLEGVQLPSAMMTELMHVLTHRLGAQEVKIQADVQVSCFTYDGIEGIRAALKAAEAAGVGVHLFSAPDYALVVKRRDRQEGIAVVQRAVEALREEVKKHGGSCVVKVEARVEANE